MAQKRPIKLMQTPGVEAGMASTAAPRFEWVDPSELLVDETYQRGLSERSVTLIRRIVGNWDWARFKPPVVALADGGYEVIDGQHTAIAAVTHPGVDKIPVMVVEAAAQSDRAAAFVGHNRDRINLTPLQVHAAAAASGDPDALTIAQVCERAGVTILRGPPGNGYFKPGDTLSVSAIGALINRRGAMRARIVLQAIAQSHASPVSASQIKAVETLLHDQEYAGQVEPADITAAIVSLGDEAEAEAKVFAAGHNVPLWRALAVILFRRARRGKRRAA